MCLSTEADDQSSLHCVIVSTDGMSDHIGRRDASRGGPGSKTSAYTGQFDDDDDDLSKQN